MSQMVPMQEKFATVRDTITSPAFVQQLKMALPAGGLTAERLARIVLTEIRRTPKLANCSRESLMAAVMQSAQYGLEPGPAGFAWLIPYGREATFQLGYKGLCQLLWRSEGIAWINAQCPREQDSFDYSLGAPPRIDYRPSDAKDRGEVTHVFAAIGTRGGGTLCEVWTKAQVDSHRKRFSKAGSGSPWDSDWEAMAKKTLLIQAAKFAPLSLEISQRLVREEMAERGISPEIDVSPLPADDPAEEADLDAIQAKLEAKRARPGAKKADAEFVGEPEIDPATGEVIPDHIGEQPELG